MSLYNRGMTSIDLFKKNGKRQLGLSAKRGEAAAGKLEEEEKPFVTEKQRGARLRLVKDHEAWTVQDWSKAIFSESNLQLFLTPCILIDLERPTSQSLNWV